MESSKSPQLHSELGDQPELIGVFVSREKGRKKKEKKTCPGWSWVWLVIGNCSIGEAEVEGF